MAAVCIAVLAAGYAIRRARRFMIGRYGKLYVEAVAEHDAKYADAEAWAYREWELEFEALAQDYLLTSPLNATDDFMQQLTFLRKHFVAHYAMRATRDEYLRMIRCKYMGDVLNATPLITEAMHEFDDQLDTSRDMLSRIYPASTLFAL